MVTASRLMLKRAMFENPSTLVSTKLKSRLKAAFERQWKTWKQSFDEIFTGICTHEINMVLYIGFSSTTACPMFDSRRSRKTELCLNMAALATIRPQILQPSSVLLPRPGPVPVQDAMWSPGEDGWSGSRLNGSLRFDNYVLNLPIIAIDFRKLLHGGFDCFDLRPHLFSAACNNRRQIFIRATAKPR